MDFVTAALQAVASFFGWSKTRAEERNRDDVVKGKVAAEETALQDAAAKAVANRDLDYIRKELSE